MSQALPAVAEVCRIQLIDCRSFEDGSKIIWAPYQTTNIDPVGFGANKKSFARIEADDNTESGVEITGTSADLTQFWVMNFNFIAVGGSIDDQKQTPENVRVKLCFYDLQERKNFSVAYSLDTIQYAITKIPNVKDERWRRVRITDDMVAAVDPRVRKDSLLGLQILSINKTPGWKLLAVGEVLVRNPNIDRRDTVIDAVNFDKLGCGDKAFDRCVTTARQRSSIHEQTLRARVQARRSRSIGR